MTDLDFAPPMPTRLDTPIGLIGCGWAASMQLAAYRAAGFSVVALADRTREKAEDLRDRYAPEATIYGSAAALLADDRVRVVDLATHTDARPALVEMALRAGRHVLSQKPFVDDLSVGERLCDLADEMGLTLAVNHNGRWAPHFAVLLAAARSGLLGDVTSADFWVYWPHDKTVAESPLFASMDDLVLYDFGIHWFDICAALVPGVPTAVYAQVGTREGQRIDAPTQAQAVLSYPEAQVSLRFRGAESRREQGGYRVNGTAGSVIHEGGSLGGTVVTTVTGSEDCQDVVTISTGLDWFGPGMTGSMGELLLSMEEGRQPSNSGRSALRGLALCFAALESVRSGSPCAVDPLGSRSGDLR